MEKQGRPSGIDCLGDVPWGTHLCQFYETAQDLVDVVVPYLRAGLENEEFCVWVASDPLSPAEAGEAARKAIPGFEEFLKRGQIEILPDEDWYLSESIFEPRRALAAWIEKLGLAEARGFAGLRAAGNVPRLDRHHRRGLVDYEEEVEAVVEGRRMIALCGHPLEGSSASDALEVVRNHRFVLARREGRWEIAESPERKRVARALQESEERYRRIVETAWEGIWTVDAEGLTTYANGRMAEMLGHAPEEMMGKPLLAFMDEEWREIAEKFMELRRQGIADEHEFVFRRRDGSGLWTSVSARPLFHEDGRYAGSLAMITDLTYRQQAEERVRDGERRFRHLIENAADIIFEYDLRPAPAFSYVSPAIFQALGYSPEEFYADPGLLSMILGDGERHGLSLMAKTSPDPRLLTLRCQHKDGRAVWMEVGIIPVHDDAGNLVALDGIARDITARQRAEEALRDSEARFQAVFANAGIGIALADTSGRLLQTNPALQATLGRTAEELRGLSYVEFTHPDDVEEDRKLARELVAGERDSYQLEKRYLRRDGEVVWGRLTSTLLRGTHGEPDLVIGLVENVTEQKRAEQVLRESESRFRRLAEGPDSWVFRYETHRTRGFSYMGPTVAQILGYSPEEFYADPSLPYKLVHPEDLPRLRELRAQCVSDRIATYRMIHRNGSVVWVEQRNLPVHDDAGREIAVEGIITNITERKQIEERLLRAQRLTTAGRIAAQVAHDFNNLLGPLVAYPELVKRQLPRNHPAAPLCDTMLRAAQQMVDINLDMLAMSRRGLLDSQVVDLNALVSEALATLGDTPSTLRVETDLAPDRLPVGGSPAQLQRVLTNLLTNAREAMLDAGVLRVSTENVYLDQPVSRYNRIEVGEYVKLTVADTGHGIPLEIQDRVFDAFFTTKAVGGMHGCGLGLSIVQALVDDHRGYVDLESEPGRGTLFSLYLPVHRGPLAEAPVGELDAGGGNESILVVDDDPPQRELMSRLLSSLGYRVTTVPSGEAALECLAQRAFDLLVLDMIMPPGIDGAETYRRAVVMRGDQRAVIVSGFAETQRVREAQALGAGPFVRKPLSLERLAQLVRRELDRQTEQPPSS